MVNLKRNLHNGLYVLPVFFALIICTCTEVPEYCGNQNPLDPSTQFCAGWRTYDKCGGKEYNPSTQGCCGGKAYNLATQGCCNAKEYNFSTEGCYSGVVKNKYNLTVNGKPTAGGDVSPTYRSDIGAGTSVNISASPSRGYRFGNWTVSGDGTLAGANNINTSVIVNGNVTVTANFIQLCTLTVNRNITNGGTVSVNDTVYTAPTIQDAIATINISAAANSGYRFVNWTVTSGAAVFADSNSATTTVRLVSNVTIRANFMFDYGSLSYGGQTYSTVVIGGKTWMAENLNYAGTNNDIGVCYNNDPSNCDFYGRLYTWAEAMNISSTYDSSTWGGSDVNHRGICPVGWHVPSNAEWSALESAVGSPSGNKLKSVTGWRYYHDATLGTDDYGFSALPGGGRWSRSSSGSFDNVGLDGFWRSATEYYASYAWYRAMNYTSGNVNSNWNSKTNMFSLRCSQDD
jgi:uncharacterized protein (TIGR02145 family)